MTIRTLMGPGGATEFTLAAVLAELATKLSEGGEVSLSAETVQALIDALVPQTDALTNTQLRAAPVPVEGTVTVSNPTAQGLTDTQLRAVPVPVTGTQTDALTDEELRAAPVPVEGTVTVSNPTAQGLTDTQLRAAPVPVEGTVTVSNPTAQGLTDTQLRAAPVPVTGTQTDALTDEELRAAPVPVEGTVTVSNPTAQGLTDAQLRAAPVPVTGPLTDVQLRAAAVSTTDATDAEYTHVPATVVDAGDTVLYTPAAGKRVRLRWISAFNDPFATEGVTIKVRLGDDEKYRGWYVSKRQKVTGPVNGALIINLSAPAEVLVTALLEEI